jgi:hypothetical protein
MRHIHTLEQAQYLAMSRSGFWVYLQCRDCQDMYKVTISCWEPEQRRREANPAIDTWQAEKDAWGRRSVG